MNQHLEDGRSKNTGASFDIFTVLSHDLKSPLNAVEAYLDIIRNRVLGDGLDPYMQILDNSMARLHQMRELITDVVDWSRIQHPSRTRMPEAMDVSRSVRAVVDGYVDEARKRSISISTDIEDGLVMHADSWEFGLMVRHLVGNAVRYNKENGSVRITMRRSGPRIVLDVADTGIGMNGEELSRLFGEFTRIKNSKTQDIRGTGLGLAIVKKLLEFYQGTITVESEPDRGTTVSVVL